MEEERVPLPFCFCPCDCDCSPRRMANAHDALLQPPQTHWLFRWPTAPPGAAKNRRGATRPPNRPLAEADEMLPMSFANDVGKNNTTPTRTKRWRWRGQSQDESRTKSAATKLQLATFLLGGNCIICANVCVFCVCCIFICHLCLCLCLCCYFLFSSFGCLHFPPTFCFWPARCSSSAVGRKTFKLEIFVSCRNRGWGRAKVKCWDASTQ